MVKRRKNNTKKKRNGKGFHENDTIRQNGNKRPASTHTEIASPPSENPAGIKMEWSLFLDTSFTHQPKRWTRIALKSLLPYLNCLFLFHFMTETEIFASG
jgi:hypothetical protein